MSPSLHLSHTTGSVYSHQAQCCSCSPIGNGRISDALVKSIKNRGKQGSIPQCSTADSVLRQKTCVGDSFSSD